jgi:hypothetical protein
LWVKWKGTAKSERDEQSVSNDPVAKKEDEGIKDECRDCGINAAQHMQRLARAVEIGPII